MDSNAPIGPPSPPSTLQIEHIAHELTTVFQAIAACATALRGQAPRDVRADRDLAVIDDAVERGRYLTTKLRGEQARRPPSPPLDVDEALRRARPLLEHVLGPAVGLMIRATPGLPRITVGEVVFEWLLVTLAINARDAMPDGGVVMIDTALVDRPNDPGALPTAPKGLQTRQYVRISMTDSGHGFAHHLRERVFRPFFTTRASARGFGLTSAALVVQEEDGWISLESRLGIGTTAHIAFPTADSRPPSPPA